MANTRALIRRRKSVVNTRKITKTMEKIATARLAKAKSAALAARPFADKLRDLVGEASRASDGAAHPLLEVRETQHRICVVVLTSDRGLCGAFNANIVKAVRNAVVEWQKQNRTLEF